MGVIELSLLYKTVVRINYDLTVFSSGLHNKLDSIGQQNGLSIMSNEETLKRLGILLLGKNHTRLEKMMATFEYLKGGHVEDAVDMFSVALYLGEWI